MAEMERPSYMTSTLSQMIFGIVVAYLIMAICIGVGAVIHKDINIVGVALDKLEGLLLLLIGPYAMREGMKRGVKAANKES